jgi:hypothetical protein
MKRQKRPDETPEVAPEREPGTPAPDAIFWPETRKNVREMLIEIVAAQDRNDDTIRAARAVRRNPGEGTEPDEARAIRRRVERLATAAKQARQQNEKAHKELLSALQIDFDLKDGGDVVVKIGNDNRNAVSLAMHKAIKANIEAGFLTLREADESPETLAYIRFMEAYIAERDAQYLALISATTGTGAATSAPEIARALDFFFHTGQEVDALQRAAADGKHLKTWSVNDERGAVIHEPNGCSFRVELLPNDDPAPGDVVTLAMLETLAKGQDADFAFTLLYIARVLAPPAPLDPNRAAIGWLDLDDIAEKIGYRPSKLSLEKRAEVRAKVWEQIKFGSLARVIGQRSSTYKDPTTGREISTVIDSAPWRIMRTEKPKDEATGLPIPGAAPLRVEVVIGKDWEPLLANAHLTQYLPMAGAIGAIPANQTAGEWARCIALTLARLWRINPRELAAGKLQPTRRELLTRYRPKGAQVETFLESPNPKRALEYWRAALGVLADSGFITRHGEAARTEAQMLEKLPKYKWGEAWLDERVDLRPGPEMAAALRERVGALPPLKPRALTVPKRKPGRPKKRPD